MRLARFHEPCSATKGVAAIVGGELRAVVERDAERRGMGLEQHVGRRHGLGEIVAPPREARVLVVADVEPRPAVEGARLDAGRVVGRQVVAERVALVDRAPQRRGLRLNGQAGAIA